LPDWYSSLVVGLDGHPLFRAAARNAEIALSQDPAFADAIGYDALRGETMVTGPLPWAPHWRTPRPWEATDDARALLWLQECGVAANISVVSEVVDLIGEAGAYHPVFDYFRTLGWTAEAPKASIWDGRPRVGGGNDVSWLTTYLGVEDCLYVRAIGEGWPMLAIARILDRGCRAPVLVLGGGEGAKFVVFESLGGLFHRGTISAIGIRDSFERLRGSWIVELSDLDALRRPDWRAVFRFVSQTADRLRHRRRGMRDHKRPFIFGATTEEEICPPEIINLSEWHFARCGAIDLAALARDRDQFWAEILVRYCGRRQPGVDVSQIASNAVGVPRNETSVMKAYLTERCELGSAYLVEKNALFEDHCAWRAAAKLHPIDKVWFGRRLRTAYPKLGHYRPDKRSHESHRRQLYRGLRLMAASTQ
jgi:hypothetical protein